MYLSTVLLQLLRGCVLPGSPEHCSSIYIYLFIYLYLFISSVIYLLSGPRDTPWCFYPDGGGGGGDCGSYNWAADGPGFTDQFYEVTRNCRYT